MYKKQNRCGVCIEQNGLTNHGDNWESEHQSRRESPPEIHTYTNIEYSSVPKAFLYFAFLQDCFHFIFNFEILYTL